MIKDFIAQLQLQLASIGDIYYKQTSKTTDYIVWNFEIYTKSYDRYEGQIIVDIVFDNIMTLLDKQELVKSKLENFIYCTETSSASVYGLILNDLSSIETDKHHHEMRFEFKLY